MLGWPIALRPDMPPLEIRNVSRRFGRLPAIDNVTRFDNNVVTQRSSTT
jgi:hypothetical protein